MRSECRTIVRGSVSAARVGDGDGDGDGADTVDGPPSVASGVA